MSGNNPVNQPTQLQLLKTQEEEVRGDISCWRCIMFACGAAIGFIIFLIWLGILSDEEKDWTKELIFATFAPFSVYLATVVGFIISRLRCCRDCLQACCQINEDCVKGLALELMMVISGVVGVAYQYDHPLAFLFFGLHVLSLTLMISAYNVETDLGVVPFLLTLVVGLEPVLQARLTILIGVLTVIGTVVVSWIGIVFGEKIDRCNDIKRQIAVLEEQELDPVQPA